LDGKGEIGFVGCTNGAGVAAPFSASFADPNCPGAITTYSIGQLYGSTGAIPDVQNTYPLGVLKGEAVREGFYFIFGK